MKGTLTFSLRLMSRDLFSVIYIYMSLNYTQRAGQHIRSLVLAILTLNALSVCLYGNFLILLVGGLYTWRAIRGSVGRARYSAI